MANRNRAARWSLSDSGLPLPIMLAVIMPLVWYGCYLGTDETKAIQAASELGYSNIEVIDKQPVGFMPDECQDGDSAKFTVTGTNSSGDQKTVTVCARPFR